MSSSQAIPKYDLDKLFQLHYEIRETGEVKNDLRPEKNEGIYRAGRIYVSGAKGF